MNSMPKRVGSRFFIIRHIHNHTSIISSEMQVELKKNTAFTAGLRQCWKIMMATQNIDTLGPIWTFSLSWPVVWLCVELF